MLPRFQRRRLFGVFLCCFPRRPSLELVDLTCCFFFLVKPRNTNTYARQTHHSFSLLTQYLTEAAIDRALLAESPLEKILRACMTRSWTEELLVSALVALPVQHALIVLAVVLVWFRRHCFHSPTHLAALHAPKTVPTMGQTVEWMTCLLDAHYAAFILTESSHQLLQVLQYDLAQQTAMCERAGDLTGILDSITKPRKPKPTSAFYSVEKLEY
eukprot:m.28110 g.28110  ORF g.28110 m.28110 type:complete len:214 (-) comp9061_c0_seq2:22-663(-)